MKLQELQVQFHRTLDAIYGAGEVRSIFYLLIDFYFKHSRLDMALDTELTLSEVQKTIILNALKRLKNEEPVQYITGQTEFFGLPFFVTKNTLIPRPETEDLVRWIIENYNNLAPIRILDIGTGTGCIAIALAKHFKNAVISALDVSEKAIAVAHKNAQLNGVKIHFVEKDILETTHMIFDPEEAFDVIVSNPPYVRHQEKEQMKPNVLKYEPHLALFVDDHNPLKYYAAISRFAVNNLKKKGALYFEINEYLGADMVMLLKENRFNDIELKKDVFGKDRMVKGVK